MTRETPVTLSRSPHNTVDMAVPDDDTTSIYMHLNVNESDKNDLLSNIESDTNFERLTHCQYFDITSFKSDFKIARKCQYFLSTLEARLKNLSQLKCYLGALEFNFSIIGISENLGTIENIHLIHVNVQTIPEYSHEHCIRSNGKRGGGVSVYVKKYLSYKISNQLALTGNEFESLVIKFDKNVFGSKKNKIIGRSLLSSNFFIEDIK